MTQELAIYVIVAGAALYLVRMIWNAMAGKNSGCGCGKGGGCATKRGAASLDETPSLLQISTRKPNAR